MVIMLSVLQAELLLTSFCKGNEMTEAKENAIQLLEKEHREAEDLFEKFEKAKTSNDVNAKHEIARQVCADLLIHMEIEEALFYPAARQATQEDALLTKVEHQAAKDLINQLGKLQPGNPMFDAKVKVLSEQIEHHVKEEENALFPKVRASSLDLVELGRQLLEKKSELKQQHKMIPA
jgi:hemerythrin-like domain-containing protein